MERALDWVSGDPSSRVLSPLAEGQKHGEVPFSGGAAIFLLCCMRVHPAPGSLFLFIANHFSPTLSFPGSSSLPNTLPSQKCTSRMQNSQLRPNEKAGKPSPQKHLQSCTKLTETTISTLWKYPPACASLRSIYS
jgi:hypothetical protein